MVANIERVRAGFDDLNAGNLDACAAPDLVMHLAEFLLPLPLALVRRGVLVANVRGKT
jgi:hypothetical protein